MSTEETATARATLNRKKRSRTGHRASATRLINQAAATLGAEDVDLDELRLTKQLLLEKTKTLKSLDEEIAELVLDDELEEEIQHADQQIERVYSTIAKINKALGGATPPPTGAVDPIAGLPELEGIAAREERRRTPPRVVTPPREPTSPRATPTPSVIGGTSATDRVKLPKISLPHFRGNPIRWTAFWDCFESAIHRNDRLSHIDKFNYLRSLLEGTAYDAIAGLALSAANYEEAITILKKRFGNKQLIVSKHMETLLSIDAVASDSHLRDLRRLYDQAEANIRSLKALGVETESYGAMLSSVLLNKLPPELRLIVSREI